MNKNISILGSTGSVGTQTLEVIENLNFNVVALSTNININLLEKQVRKFLPKIVCVVDSEKAKDLRIKLSDLNVRVLESEEGLKEIASLEEVGLVVNAVVGNAGLSPTIAAIEASKNIALANKEVLVSSGKLIMQMAKEKNVNIYPVDSEHSAIFQCLQGNEKNKINKIILTASGGPFKNLTSLENVTIKDALNHPNWSMGKKITIDSATLMNKGLEVIEAKWLFNLPVEKIEVLVHPQSVVHSMVEFEDTSVMAQLGSPSMKVPIQYALTYPKRVHCEVEKLDLLKLCKLTFEKPNVKLFPCLKLGYEAIKIGGTLPAVLNASNEVAVHKFLKGKIKYKEIPSLIEKTITAHKIIKNYTLDQIFEADKWAREYALKL